MSRVAKLYRSKPVAAREKEKEKGVLALTCDVCFFLCLFLFFSFCLCLSGHEGVEVAYCMFSQVDCGFVFSIMLFTVRHWSFLSSGTWVCTFSSFPLFNMLCVRCLRASRKKVYVSLWTLRAWMWRSWRCVVVMVCIVPLMLVVRMMSGSSSHPGWDRSGRRMAYLAKFIVNKTYEVLTLP